MLFFMVISAAFLAGIVVNGVLRNSIQELINDTEEMETTRNSFLKQMKLRYKNCMRIGHEIHNTEAFAGKYMEKYRNYGISIHGYEKIISVCSGLCVIGGVVGAFYDRAHTMEFLLLGFLAMYIVNGLKRMLDIYGKKRKITLNIVDYFENKYYAVTKENQEENHEENKKTQTMDKKVDEETFSEEEKRLIDDILREYLG